MYVTGASMQQGRESVFVTLSCISLISPKVDLTLVSGQIYWYFQNHIADSWAKNAGDAQYFQP